MRNLLEELSSGQLKGRKRQTQRRIISAASALIERLGYRRASMDEVARRAGIAKGTVYLYFPSKVDLLVACIAEERRRQLEQMLPRLRRELSPEERLQTWIEAELVTRSEMPISQAVIAGEPELRSALEAIPLEKRERLLGIEMGFVEHLVRSGPWGEEGVRERVAVLLSIVYRGMPELHQRGSLRAPEYARTLARMLVEGVAGEPEKVRSSSWF